MIEIATYQAASSSRPETVFRAEITITAESLASDVADCGATLLRWAVNATEASLEPPTVQICFWSQDHQQSSTLGFVRDLLQVPGVADVLASSHVQILLENMSPSVAPETQERILRQDFPTT